MTKKLSKKLISIFLSLLMVLSLIPMGTMSAYAALSTEATCSAHPNAEHICVTSFTSSSSWKCTVYSTDGFVQQNVGPSSWFVQTLPSNTTVGSWLYRDDSTSSFSLCDGHPAPACGKCTACGHEWSKHKFPGDSWCDECDTTDPCWGPVMGEACTLDKGHTGPCSATAGPTEPNWTPITIEGKDYLYDANILTIKKDLVCSVCNDSVAQTTGDKWYTTYPVSRFTNCVAAGHIKEAPAEPTPLTFTAEEAGATMSFNWSDGSDVQVKASSTSVTVGGSNATGEWQDYTATTTITLPNVGDSVQFKGTDVGTSKVKCFTINDKKIKASGDVTSLTNGVGGEVELETASCYSYMFHNCSALTSAPNLPSTTLTESCYQYMFNNCSALTSAPELPATELVTNCYRYMFNNCTSLTTAPELKSTALANGCYRNMFYGCKSLTTAPELPATELVADCYRFMFFNCSGLTTASEIKATKLANNCCGSMFYGCTSLTTAPELKATQLADDCYNAMFCGCTSLTSAPELPATKLADNCYSLMFMGCTSLTTGPELPATELANSCYYKMFSGCTGLTSAPELKATTLAARCYYSMFYGCTGLRVVETDNQSEATWIFPAEVTVKNWNDYMLDDLTAPGTLTAVEAGKMYKVTAVCGMCTECGHPMAKHAIGNHCSLCTGTSGCYDEILGEQCVLDAGHDGAHDSWLPITNTDDINAILTKVAGEFKDAEYPDDYSIKISGNATDGFSFVYKTDGSDYNAVFVKAKQKGNEVYLEINFDIDSSTYQAGFTFKFDSQGKLTNCYQVTYEDGDVDDYYMYPYTHVHTWDNGTCTLDGTTCSHTNMTTSDATCGTCGITNPNYVPPHTHTYDTAWSKDSTHHWHAATCGHTDQKSDYAQHSYSSEVTTPATCTSAGVTTYTCTCGDTYTDTTTPAATGHKFATTWSSDANQHWYAATCAHTTEKSSVANHTYGTTGDARFTCTVCSAVNEAKKLQFAKADAKAAIDEYLGESENEDADAVANKAKQDIDAATTVEDVNAIKNKALVDLKDIIAPDFATLNRDIKYDGTVTKLTKDYTRAKAQQGIVIGDGDKVIIDLNGHTIDGANDKTTSYGFIFAVNGGGELVIMDSTDNEGVITGGAGYYSGSERLGGAIYNNGTTTINGGTFTGNTATTGGVIGNGGTLTINGGVFTNNSSTSQGGVVDSSIPSSVTLITGGTFTNNTSSIGGVVENYNGSVVTIIGGTFTDNTATMNGGAIDNYEATLYIGGSAVVKDNKVGENTNNFELETGTVALADTAFTEDAEIGVSFTYVVDTFIAEGATLDTLKALKSDDATKMFIVEDGAVKLQNIADHVHAGGSATCQVKAICQSCGASYGNYAQHSYTDYVSDENATCTEDGTKTASCDYECGTTDTITDKDSATGHKYTSKVTTPATYAKAGVRTYTCSNGCGSSYKETIPRLKITSTVKYNNSTKMCASFKVSSLAKDVTAKWGKVADADGYIVYAAYCGKDFKAIKTIKGADTTSYSFTKLDGKKLDLNKNFKVYVVAYKVIDGKKVEFGKSLVGHVIGGKNTKYTNPTKVTVKNSKVTLAKGKTSTIKATVTYKYEGKKHISDAHAPEKRYRSSNRAVATVDKNGKITAVGKGTCTIYVFAKNGNPTKVTVTVK